MKRNPVMMLSLLVVILVVSLPIEAQAQNVDPDPTDVLQCQFDIIVLDENHVQVTPGTACFLALTNVSIFDLMNPSTGEVARSYQTGDVRADEPCTVRGSDDLEDVALQPEPNHTIRVDNRRFEIEVGDTVNVIGIVHDNNNRIYYQVDISQIKRRPAGSPSTMYVAQADLTEQLRIQECHWPDTESASYTPPGNG